MRREASRAGQHLASFSMPPWRLMLSAAHPQQHALQVAGIIVGARNASHVADHEKIFSFELDAGAAARACLP